MRDELLAAEKVKAIEWRDGTLFLLDQRLLPGEEAWHGQAFFQIVTAAAGSNLRRPVVRLNP